LIRPVMVRRFGRPYGVRSHTHRTHQGERMQPSARTIGIVYLLYPLTALFGAFLLKGIVVPGDAAATATHILAHVGQYRAGFAFDLLGNVIYLALTALFYEFFRCVNRSISLVAAFCGLAGCTIQIMGDLLRIAPLVILQNAHLATLYSVEQLNAAALLSITLHSETLRISYLVFAVFDFMIGYLIVRSTFVPSILGWFMMAAGVAGLTLLWPPLAVALYYVILPLGGLAELMLMFWLIVRGGGVRPQSAPLG
jgi:hypothetical protein